MKIWANNLPTIEQFDRFGMGLLVGLICLVSATGLLANELAVPAEFVRDIKLPGMGELIGRPNALYYDHFNEEILVADSGTNRILIFSQKGVYKYSFSLADIMSSPRGLATDADGFIYILGSKDGVLVLRRFDFDGTPLGIIDFPREIEGIPVDLRHLASDDSGSLFALDHTGRRILKFGNNDEIVKIINIERRYEIPAENSEGFAQGEGSYALGIMVCVRDTLYIPISNGGTVHRYSTNGEFLGSIGYFGAKPGTLNFPVAVDVSPEGVILVLDRSRYSVVCFSPDNKFLGEFGGRGFAPGWFMGPAFLAVPSAEWAVVGQLYKSKIQVCTVPEFIRAKVHNIPTEQAVDVEGDLQSSNSAGDFSDLSQRRLSHNSRPIPPTKDGEFPSSTSIGAYGTHTVSYPEVSE